MHLRAQAIASVRGKLLPHFRSDLAIRHLVGRLDADDAVTKPIMLET